MKRRLLACLFAAAGCSADTAVENTPPTLQLDSPTQLVHTVGDGVVRISLTATDPDGDPVSISLVEGPERAILQDTGKLAVFTWDPIVSDVTPSDAPPRRVVFAATDTRGGVTEKTVRIEVVPGNGVPRFQKPAPTVLHRIDQEESVEFDVLARDDDSAEVQISLVDGSFPPGAIFTQTASFAGMFSWSVPEEARQQQVHPVTFRVTDGQNPPQDLEVSIVLKKGRTTVQPKEPDDVTGCVYEDTVRHTVLGPQSGSEDYEVTVTVDEPYDNVTLYWTNEDPWNESPDFESIALEKQGNTYTGSIKNPLVSEGDSEVISYEICASDTDANEVLCGPSHIYHSFVAMPPGTVDCIDDAGLPADTFDDAYYNSSLDDGIYYSFNTCPNTPDYHEFEIDPNQVIDIYILGDNISIEQYDEERNLESTLVKSCKGLYTYQLENTANETAIKFLRVLGEGSPYTMVAYFADLNSCASFDEPNEDPDTATPLENGESIEAEICPVGDFDLYAISLQEGEVATIDATFTHANGDLDLELWPPSARGTVGNDDGTSVATAFSTTDNEQMVFTAQESGTHYLLVDSYDAKTSDYEISLSITSSCVDNDGLAQSNSQSTAVDVFYRSYPDLKLCPQTADWFSFFALEFDTLNVTATPKTGDVSDLRMTIWHDDAFYEFGEVVGNSVEIDTVFFDAGEYLIQVVSPVEMEYDLELNDF